MVDLYPFLMRFEDTDEPIERAGHLATRNYVSQSAGAPTIEGWQQHMLCAFYGCCIIPAQGFSLQRTVLLARPTRRFKEVCPSAILQWLLPAVARKLQSGARRFHTRDAKSCFPESSES